jgi:CDP-diacylglycerol--glycerol-3-phosphate 3-phosphatidyltransferase
VKVETAGRSKETAIESGQRFLLTLPNLLSFLRIGLIPFILILLNFPGPGWSLVAALLFVTASLTDFLDGYFARRYRMVTKVGKLLDPVADKLLTLTPLIMLIPLREVPAWVVVVMV